MRLRRGRRSARHLDGAGAWQRIAPQEIAAQDAPCKEVRLTGDDIDITKFAFVKTNPADGGDYGRYVNTGSVFMDDPELGYNFGTYRCQIKGPRGRRWPFFPMGRCTRTIAAASG